MSLGLLLADLAAATTVAEIENVQERIVAAEDLATAAALDALFAEMRADETLDHLLADLRADDHKLAALLAEMEASA